MNWARMLVYITGTVDQELLLRNEYLAAENRILKAQIKGRLLLSEADKATLAEIAHRLGRKALEEVAATAKPDTILGCRASKSVPAPDEASAAQLLQLAGPPSGL
jgi:putative transposase